MNFSGYFEVCLYVSINNTVVVQWNRYTLKIVQLLQNKEKLYILLKSVSD